MVLRFHFFNCNNEIGNTTEETWFLDWQFGLARIICRRIRIVLVREALES